MTGESNTPKKRPVRCLLVRWLWPEILWKLHEPERLSAQRLVDEGLIRDHEKDFAEHLARTLRDL